MKNRSPLPSIGFVLACAVWFGLAMPRAHAQATPNPPGKMSYQGFLTDDTGVPLGSTAPLNRDIVFRLFTAPTGGTLKWAEQQTVTLDKGFFTVQLGEGSGVGSSPFTNNLASLFTGADASDRYLEITVKGTTDLTISPRVQLLTSPYAFLARNAVAIVSGTGQQLVTTSGTSVGINLSGTPTATLDVNGTLKATSFTGSGAGLTGISTAALADQSITSVKIAPNAVGPSEIAASAVSSGEIQDGTVGTVDLADNSVTSAKIANQSIQSFNIAAGAVGSSEILDQSIQSVDIGPDAVGSSELKDNSVSSDKIVDGSITAADLASSVGVWTKSGSNYSVTGGVEVGINTTAPGRPLHVTATESTASGANYLCLRLEAGPRADYWDFGLDNDDGESGDDADLVFLYKGTEKGYLDATSGGFLVGSDRRLKKEIETLPHETLSRVMKIPVVRFRMIDQQPNTPKQVGVIAQDVQAFYPELVEEHRGTLSVRYDRIGVISMAAVQELKTEKDGEIRELMTENASLKQQMSQILERLKALEQKGR